MLFRNNATALEQTLLPPPSQWFPYSLGVIHPPPSPPRPSGPYISQTAHASERAKAYAIAPTLDVDARGRLLSHPSLSCMHMLHGNWSLPDEFSSLSLSPSLPWLTARSIGHNLPDLCAYACLRVSSCPVPLYMILSVSIRVTSSVLVH